VVAYKDEIFYICLMGTTKQKPIVVTQMTKRKDQNIPPEKTIKPQMKIAKEQRKHPPNRKQFTKWQ
jgi:hypothetical protein